MSDRSEATQSISHPASPEDRVRALRESLTDGVVELDAEGHVVAVNATACELTGYDQEELEGTHCEAVVGEATCDRFAELSPTDDTVSYRASIQTASGAHVGCACRLTPLVSHRTVCGAIVVLERVTNISLERELERRNRQQSVVATLGELALESDDLDQLMAETTQLVADTLETNYCKVLDLDTDERELLLRQGVGWQEGIVGNATVAADDNSQAGYTLLSAEPVVVTDLETETRFSGPELLTSHDVTSGISVIIGSVEEPWGILGTHDTDPRTFTDDDVAFIQSVANVLATAIERREREQALERQRTQLATLDELNEVVRGIIDAIIECSTREGIEEAVCAHLADADSYTFAWIGEVERESQTVTPRAEAGAGAYLEETTISVNPDDEQGQGPTGRAIRTHDMAVTSDVCSDPRHDPWHKHAHEYGYTSSAAIPVGHEETIYGVLNVYADRPQAFTDRERTVIGQLGEIVGHAIAAVERKRALTSDELVEIELQHREFLTELVGPTTEDRISFEQTVPIGDGRQLAYGTTTEDGLEVLKRLVATQDTWREVTVISETFGEVRFELQIRESPVITVLTAHGGSIERAVIEDGTLRMTVRLPRGADVRQVIERLQEIYPEMEPLTRRQVTQSSSERRIERAWIETLTDRQRAALEAAYFAGFFDWPRESTGEVIAESLDIAPATFHQHLRTAERKLFGTLLDRQSISD